MWKNRKKIENSKRKKSMLTGHHHKLFSYWGTTFLTRYSHLRKSGAYPPLPHTTHSLLTLQDILFFILILKSICRGGWGHDRSLQIHFKGRVRPLPTHTNIFLFYSENSFKLNIVEQIKKSKTYTLWLLWTIDIKNILNIFQ